MVQRLKNICWVIPKDNDLILYDANGKEVPGQLKIRVTAELDSFPTAFIQCIVNIAKDENEMNEIRAGWLMENKSITT